MSDNQASAASSWSTILQLVRAMHKEEQVKYLANIYAVVAVDGDVDRIETRIFEEVSRGIGAGYFERKKAVDMASSETLPVRLAARWSEQIRNLEDMLFVAYADGTLEPDEKKVIVDYAKFLGINQKQLGLIKGEAKSRFAQLK